MSVYKFEAKQTNGHARSLSDFSGDVLLIVNTASECGFTPQYEGLEALHQQFKSQGFSVLGFPCNQFGEQEPGTNEEIKTFCRTNYNVTFPLFEKISVNGEDADPLFEYLKSHEPSGDDADIQWNFTKFLIDQEGQVVKRFGSKVTPEDITSHVKALVN